jgi:hypothetical protein
MIPHFPTFKKLEISDRTSLEKLIRQHPPYSDYNFVSLFSWDTEEKVEISNYYSNLIIKFVDYVTNEQFYSLLGTNRVDETIIRLIEHAASQGLDTTLHLVPQTVVQHIKNPAQFVVKEDPDNADYILSIKDLIEMRGKNFRGKKNFINRFKRVYEKETRLEPIDLTKKEIQSQVLKLFEDWERERGKTRKETQNELSAITKLLKHAHQLDLKTIGLFVSNRLVGFSINELVQDSHGVIHYEKADISYIGVFQYLKHQSALYLQTQGARLINYEQDLGIEGLRKAKLSYQPVSFLKKYTISKK